MGSSEQTTFTTHPRLQKYQITHPQNLMWLWGSLLGLFIHPVNVLFRVFPSPRPAKQCHCFAFPVFNHLDSTLLSPHPSTPLSIHGHRKKQFRVRSPRVKGSKGREEGWSGRGMRERGRLGVLPLGGNIRTILSYLILTVQNVACCEADVVSERRLLSACCNLQTQVLAANVGLKC